MAHILRKSNFQKTYHYLKRNGFKNAYYAVLERVKSSKGSDYHYEEAEEEVLAKQKQEAVSSPYRFSILVPAYETKEEYLREMIESVLGQSYGKFELIIADASQSDAVQKTVNGYLDRRIRYLRLEENKGISENTNAALAVAKGEYIGLLDHDDVLTPDALYEMSKAIRESVQRGKTAWLLYSDEDKGNGDMTEFYEPHRKHGLNMDLLFSNNYICHFLVMRRELMRSLRFRPDYDGAQDYDLILRAIGRLIYEEERGRDSVIHIPKVLYHWRCHAESTAENPKSKQYAYEAGRRALEDFMAARGWRGKAEHTLHLGFYRIAYENSIFAQRKEVGVIGGKLVDKKGCIAGGIYNSRGRCLYAGLNRNFSGYMHRAGLDQEAYAVDLRCMRVKKELWGIFEDVFGISYREKEMGANRRFPYEEIMFSAGKESSARGSGEIKRNETNAQEGGTDIIKGETGTKKGDTDGVANADDNLKKLCIEFGRRVRRAGYTVVWLPDWEWKIYGKNSKCNGRDTKL